MDRRTFLKVVALSPAAAGGLLVAGAGGVPSDVHQEYPVYYGMSKAYGIGAGCPVGFGNEEQEKTRLSKQ